MSCSQGSSTLASYSPCQVGSSDAAPVPVRSTSDSQVPTNMTTISGLNSSSCWFQVKRTVGSRRMLGVRMNRTSLVPSASTAAFSAGASPAITESPARTIRNGSAVGRAPGSGLGRGRSSAPGGRRRRVEVGRGGRGGRAVVVRGRRRDRRRVSSLPCTDAPTE